MNKHYILLAALAMSVPCASCGSGETYTITVLNKHGQAVKDAAVKIGNKTVATDENGRAVFSLSLKNETALTFDSLPDGYSDSSNTKIKDSGDYTVVLDSTLREGTIKRGTSIGIGDLAYNYSFTACEYNENNEVTEKAVSLREMLDTHDFIAINCFFFDCSWCIAEAPYLSEVNNEYKDRGYLLGIDQNDLADSKSSLCDFKAEENLNFDIAYDIPRLTNGLAVKSWPTTVVIDRYGFICFWYAASFRNSDELRSVFASFSGDDYVPRFYKTDSLEKDI